jgi:hypothetical protein
MGLPWTEQITQSLTVAADGLHAVSEAAGTYSTSAVNLQKFRKVLFVIDTGSMGSSATIDFQVKAATTSGGSYSAVPGTSITQATQAGSNGNKWVFVEVSADHLQNAMGGSYQYLKGALTVGTAACVCNVLVLGALGGHEPASDSKDASLLQTVVL